MPPARGELVGMSDSHGLKPLGCSFTRLGWNYGGAKRFRDPAGVAQIGPVIISDLREAPSNTKVASLLGTIQCGR